MMKLQIFKRIPLLFLTLLWNTLFAQKPLLVSLDEQHLKPVPVGCYVEKVIDARENKTNIGFAQKGMMNEKVPAYFVRPAEEELQSLFSRSFPAGNTIPLIIRINHLDIYEFTRMNESAYAVVNLTFIRRESNKYYEEFESAVTVENKGADVTHSHDKNITKAIQQSFTDYHQMFLAGKLSNNLISDEDLSKNSLLKQHYKIHSISEIPRGIFHSFYDFRDFRPDTSRAFEIYHDPNSWDTREMTVKWKDDKSKIKDA